MINQAAGGTTEYQEGTKTMVNRSNDERLLDLRALVRARFERDLRDLADISASSAGVTMDELLDSLHAIYVNYIQQNTLLNGAAYSLRKEGSTSQENKLRSIDES